MTQPDDAPVLFAEPGSSFWPLLWGPIFAAVGAALDALTGRVHAVAWVLVGVGLAGLPRCGCPAGGACSPCG